MITHSYTIVYANKLLHNNELADCLPEATGNPGFHRSFSVIDCYAALERILRSPTLLPTLLRSVPGARYPVPAPSQ
jgi:hypothetical protein